FHAALAAAGCRPDQAVHIGDSLIHDVAGARGVGIYSVWLNRKGLRSTNHVPDFEINTLEVLTECLERVTKERK
ncbi:MAG: HAD family hydrolase, partial [Deltaproteobacteria bacterium]|nr:HAD family hydrolase [Deltaproteobacteria bacterium]